MAYLAKFGPDICYFRSDNPKQCSTPTSTNNRINSKINQQRIIFVDWCYCGREVLFEKVSLFAVYKFVLHGKQFLVIQKKGIEWNTSNFHWVIPVWRMSIDLTESTACVIIIKISGNKSDLKIAAHNKIPFR